MTLTAMISAPAAEEAYVTLVTSDSYVVGALVLAHSLRSVGATRKLVCMVTSNLAADSVATLRECYEVRFVAPLDSRDERRLNLLGRPELGPTFTKLQLWSLTDLSKVVFLDADMMVLKNIDDLFEREELSACADVGWPDCFNSGLFVARPSLETYNNLLALSRAQGSFDGGDQGLLNTYFGDWAHGPSSRRIPFVYNLTFNACYSYLPAFERNKDQVRAVHFIGANKPWTFNRFSDGQVAPRGDGASVHLEYVQKWWILHDQFVKPKGSSSKPPSFMSLYNGSGYNALNGYGSEAARSGKLAHGHGNSMDSDFANYRIKWTDDVETFFQKKSLSKMPSRKLVSAGDDSEDERNFDPEIRMPIPKPPPTTSTTSSSTCLSR